VALTDDITDPRLAKALAHPLRLEILRHLGDRTASPSEIAAEIGAPLTNVSYHVRKLRSLGLIKLVRKTPKRGVVEHYYAAKPRKTMTDREWGAMPGIVKDAMASSFVESALKTAADAADASGFTREEAHMSRRQMKLDERGWNEVAAVLARALDDVIRIDEATTERLKGDAHPDTFGAASVMLLFETPEQLAMPSEDSLKSAERAGRPRTRARS
jgi:DNA-binding transcriptional ArsR family regulator